MKKELKIIFIAIIILFSIIYVNAMMTPDSSNQESNIIPQAVDSSNVINQNLNRITADENGIINYNSISQTEKPKSHGYIIEFQDEPSVVEYTKLKNEAKTNEQKIKSMSALNPTKYVYSTTLLREKDVPVKVNDYRIQLKNKNSVVKDKIKEKLIPGFHSEKPNLWNNFINTITGNAVSSTGYDNSGLKVIAEWDSVFNGIALNISAADVEQIKNIPGVKSVSPNLEVHADLMDSVPLIGADKVWQLDADGNNCTVSGKQCLTGKNVTIGIIDTGVDYTHPDLGGCFGTGCKVIGGYDFVNNDNDPMDDMGHGTHCAGIAAGSGAGGLKGVAPDAKIYAYKVLDSVGSGSFVNVISAINRAIDPNQDGNFNDHLDVLSMSFGASGYPCSGTDVENVISNSMDLGITIVIAAGNDGRSGKNTIGYPGCFERAITVGSSRKDSLLSDFSSKGFAVYNGEAILKPDILAPGENICSAEWDSAWSSYKCLDDKHVTISGTSMATPHVSGAVALLKQVFPDLNPYEIKNVLMNNANPINSQYKKLEQGSGIINILKSINNYKTNKIILNPGSISFGIVDLSKDVWSNSKAINITYRGPLTLTGSVSINGNFPTGVIFEYPPVINIQDKNSFNFKIKVEKNIPFGYYDGELVFQSTLGIIKIPFFFKKIKLEIQSDKNLTNSNISFYIKSEIPLSSINGYVIDPNSINHDITFVKISDNDLLSSYTPQIDGKHVLKIEARDKIGNILYGESEFTADLTKPIITLNIDKIKNEIVLKSNEDISSKLTEAVKLTEVNKNTESPYETRPSLIEGKQNIFLENTISTDGFYGPDNIYATKINIFNYPEKTVKVVDGPQLFLYLNQKINRPFLGFTVFIKYPSSRFPYDPLMISSPNKQIYLVYPYYTNNIFCGINGIGIKKLINETENQWITFNNTIYLIDICTNDVELCKDPSKHHDKWCNSTTQRYIYNIKALVDRKDDIYLFWVENTGEGKSGLNYFRLYFKKIDKNGNTLIDKTELTRNDQNDIVYTSFDCDVDSKNNVSCYIYLSRWHGDNINDGKQYQYENIIKKIDTSNSIKIYETQIRNIYVFGMRFDNRDNLYVVYREVDYIPEDYLNYNKIRYGILKENGDIELIKMFGEDFYNNGLFGFDLDDKNNFYIDYGRAYSTPNNWFQYYNYSVYNNKEKYWLEGKMYESNTSSDSVINVWSTIKGVLGDKFGNIHFTYNSNKGDGLIPNQLMKVGINVFYEKYAKSPILKIIYKNNTEDFFNMKYNPIDNSWEINFSDFSNIFYIEAFGTDNAGNIGYLKFMNEKPSSKLTNNAQSQVTGTLTLILQNNLSGTWQDIQTVANKPITIPAQGSYDFKSDWNPVTVKPSSAGNYRVLARFEANSQIKEASYEFKVQ